jgi:hypothetical protein
MFAMLYALNAGQLTDQRFITAASALAGSRVRVGGISCDFTI